jgi:hypothetical protein
MKKFILLTCFIAGTALAVDLKISQLPQLLNANTNPSDSIPIVDSVVGQTKQISLGQLDLRYQGLPSGGVANQVLGKNSSVNGDISWKTIDKSYVGLGNVNNTSDINKPVSTATQDALNLKANSSALVLKADKTYVDTNLLLKQDKLPNGTNGYVLTLDSGSPTWLPSSGGGGAVDSVFGRTGVVTAQSGDYTKAQVGLDQVDNTADLDKPISDATQSALNAKQNSLGTGAEAQVLTWISGTPTWQPSSSAAPSVTGSLGAPLNITSGSGISFSGTNVSNIKFVKSNGGSVNITANPQIQAGDFIGQNLELYFTSDTDILILEDGDGLDLPAVFVSANKRFLSLWWTGSAWAQKYRR